MWTALQGIRDCVVTWEEDGAWADANPSRDYPGKKSDLLGKRFQMFQFQKRLSWDDVESVVRMIRKMEEAKIAHKEQVDKRGYVS